MDGNKFDNELNSFSMRAEKLSADMQRCDIELQASLLKTRKAIEKLEEAQLEISLQLVNHHSAKLLSQRSKESRAKALKLEIAPGFRLHRWLSSCCPRSFKENVLDELLATGTFMYQEALAQEDYKAARRIRYAMRFWMLRAVFGGSFSAALSLLGQFRRKSE